jgi:hypothetical protein
VYWVRPSLNPREVGFFLGRAQRSWVISLVDPKEKGSFPWSCLKENGPSIGLAQGRRVVPLAMLKGDESFT